MTVVFLFIIILFTSSSALAQCPKVTIVGPAGVTDPGDKILFRTEVSHVGPRVDYQWSVSSGTIVSGQGTPEIEVMTDAVIGGTNLTATVTLKGLSPNCENSVSETAPIAARLEWEALDEWGPIKDNDQRSRLDNLFAELANNPHQIGLIVLIGPKGKYRTIGNRRMKLIMDHVRFRNFDADRIWFCVEQSDVQRTRIYRFPPNLKGQIPCESCQIIKGGDL